MENIPEATCKNEAFNETKDRFWRFGEKKKLIRKRNANRTKNENERITNTCVTPEQISFGDENDHKPIPKNFREEDKKRSGSRGRNGIV